MRIIAQTLETLVTPTHFPGVLLRPARTTFLNNKYVIKKQKRYFTSVCMTPTGLEPVLPP